MRYFLEKFGISIAIMLLFLVLPMNFALAVDSVNNRPDAPTAFLQHMRCERASRILTEKRKWKNCFQLSGYANFILGDYAKAAKDFDEALNQPFVESEFINSKMQMSYLDGFSHVLMKDYKGAEQYLEVVESDEYSGSSLIEFYQHLPSTADSAQPDPNNPSWESESTIEKYKGVNGVNDFFKDLKKTKAHGNPNEVLKPAEQIELSWTQIVPSICSLRECEPSAYSSNQGTQNTWDEAKKIQLEASAQEDLGSFINARKLYKKAIAICPNDGSLHADLALCEFSLLPVTTEQDKLNVSVEIEELTKAAELEPKNWKIWNNLGSLQLLAGNKIEGLDCYRQALKYVPSGMCAVILIHSYSMTKALLEVNVMLSLEDKAEGKGEVNNDKNAKTKPEYYIQPESEERLWKMFDQTFER